MIKRFKTFLYEMALPLSTYKKVISKAKPNFDIQKKYFEIFSHYDTGPRKGKKPYRIYFPYENKKTYEKNPFSETNELNVLFMMANIKGYIKEKYEVEDYFMGIAINENGKRIIKIGKLLQQIIKRAEKNTNENSNYIRRLKKALDNFSKNNLRKLKNSNKYFIVISHHPYDVAGMSTNRGWTSCMSLFDGSNHTYVYSDIREGTIIAYLVKSDDPNIENPVGRILIKPYVNITNRKEFMLIPAARTYGTFPEKATKIVYDWCEEVNQKYLGITNKGFYCLNLDIYNDNDKPLIIKKANDLKDKNLTDSFWKYFEIFDLKEISFYKRIGIELCKNENISPENCYKFLMLYSENYRYYSRSLFHLIQTVLENIPLERAYDIIDFILKKHKEKKLPELNTLLEFLFYVTDSMKFLLEVLEKYNYNDNCIDKYSHVENFIKETIKKKISADKFWKYLRFFNFKEYQEKIFWIEIFKKGNEVFKLKIPEYYFGNIIATINKIFDDASSYGIDVLNIIELIERYNDGFLKTIKYVNEELFNMIYIDVYYNEKYESLRNMFEKKFSKEELEKIIDEEE